MTCYRKSLSYDHLNLRIRCTDNDYDYGPLIRFNIYVIEIVFKYGKIMNVTDSILYNQLNYIKVLIGSDPIYKHDYRIIQLLDNVEPVTNVIYSILYSKNDSDVLKIWGIRAPLFVLFKHVPFDEKVKIEINNRILKKITFLNPHVDRLDVYLELHRMWSFIDDKKWMEFAKPVHNHVEHNHVEHKHVEHKHVEHTQCVNMLNKLYNAIIIAIIISYVYYINVF